MPPFPQHLFNFFNVLSDLVDLFFHPRNIFFLFPVPEIILVIQINEALYISFHLNLTLRGSPDIILPFGGVAD